MKRAIQPATAPQAVGPYSPAITAGDFLYTAGQVAIDPIAGKITATTITDQTDQVMKNLEAILTAAGLEMNHIVKTTVFLTKMSDFAAMNDVYAKYFSTPYPARSTVAVKDLPLGALVEIEAVAIRTP